MAIGQAQGYLTCQTLLQQNNRSAANDNPSPQQITRGHQAEVALWSSLLGDLGRDNDVRIILDERNSVQDSYYNGFINTISLGYHAPTSNPIHRSVILAHEFAHAIFQKHFEFTVAGKTLVYRDLVVAAAKDDEFVLSNLEYQALARETMEIDQTLTLAHEVGHEELVVDLTKHLEAKSEELASLTPRLNLFKKWRSFFTPYNELFADSLPVILWKNPMAMSEAMVDPQENYLATVRRFLTYGGRNNRAVDEARSFRLMPFKDWKAEVASEYTLFDPARGVLWALFIKNLKIEEIPIYMRTHLMATAQHATLRLARGEDPLDAGSYALPTQLNQEFVQIFVRLARENGLLIRRTP